MWKNCFSRSFLIVYYPDQYKTQKKCDKAFDCSLAALKLVPHWFVTRKMIKELFTTLYADENILCIYDDYGNVVFSCNEMGIINIRAFLENNGMRAV